MPAAFSDACGSHESAFSVGTMRPEAEAVVRSFAGVRGWWEVKAGACSQSGDGSGSDRSCGPYGDGSLAPILGGKV